MKYDKKRFEGLTADEKKAQLLKDIMTMLSQDPLYNGAKVSLTFRDKETSKLDSVSDLMSKD